MIENDDETPEKETLVFLYKFVDGSCPKSHGFNAARTFLSERARASSPRKPSSIRAHFLGLANIPSSIVELAQTKASAFERWVTLKRVLLTLKKGADHSEEHDLLSIISQLKLN